MFVISCQLPGDLMQAQCRFEIDHLKPVAEQSELCAAHRHARMFDLQWITIIMSYRCEAMRFIPDDSDD
ncbi:MAG TPA: hypothetical protein PLI12_07645 [Acetobacteraceae bacterium]|nr:hypothetical protein [Acetobacteraceae bacterium]HQU02306.1 hypothetical protein [Acetobacteraceae bacterium]